MLHYRRYGRTGAPTVVLQHGFVSSGRIFAPLGAALSDRFDIIATDLPGLGGSAGLSAPESVAALARQVVDTVSELGVERFAILGNSLGAQTALHVAVDFPDRVRKLVLYGGCAGDLPERFESYEESIARIRREGIVATAARIASRWFVDGTDNPMYPFTRDCGKDSSEEGAIHLIRAMAGFDLRGRLNEVRAPTLVVCGDSDRTTHPRHSFEMWRGIAEAQLCIIPRSGHVAHLEVPEAFNRVVARFLMD
jgi:pimeloyl-ACP methyl ester carboxylesterase